MPSTRGGVPEWPKGSDCKSAGTAFEGSNPSPSTIFYFVSIFFCLTSFITHTKKAFLLLLLIFLLITGLFPTLSLFISILCGADG
jgi:hypothetical protein